ncbi:fluoride efflux transporter CrcB [Cytobacillus sp. Hz8]|uniref:fluoride efflux transporter CrcB n=1 Tax=Cytobacillus sp. Hz8 TaxID=3347168 RepID=UPI0035DCA985
MLYFLVGIGGIIGSLLRYFVSNLASNWGGQGFPYGTLFVNLSGAFILGWITKNLSNHPKLHPYFVTTVGTGIVGSYTTFSTLSVETVTFINHGEFFKALLYVTISLIGGMAFALWGFNIGNKERQGEKG